uniref:Uncharacterized protein n=1 Tax=Aegilops tauschii subsp. strangulata TaxID=200361 RepID=A0A453F0X1_AEGTS
QSSNQLLQQEKPGTGNMPVDGGMPNSFGATDQVNFCSTQMPFMVILH